MDAARRYIEVLAFLALWMSLGSIFHLDTNFYLLIGVPLVVFFQRFVRQPPLRQLWVRDAAAFRLSPAGIVIAVLLILAPGYDLFVAAPKRLWGVALSLLCALAGAVFAAFAITQQRASAARRGLPRFITAVLIGMAIMAASALANHHGIGVPLSKLSSLLYFAFRSLSCSRRLRFAALSIRTFISFQLTENSAAARHGSPQFLCRLYREFGIYPHFPLGARQDSQVRSPRRS